MVLTVTVLSYLASMLTSKRSGLFCDVVMNNLANIYLFKANKRNTGKGCEICSKLTIKIGILKEKSQKNQKDKEPVT